MVYFIIAANNGISSNKPITENTFLFGIRRVTGQSKVFKNIFI